MNAPIEPRRSAQRRRRRSYRPDWPRIAVVVAVVLVALVGVALGATTFVISRMNSHIVGTDGEPFPEPQGTERVNILLMGLDAKVDPATGKIMQTTDFSNRRSDVMMLISADPVTKKVAVISIPRDSRVQIPGHGLDKINSAHARGGPALAMETVEQFLGIPVHYYVRTSFDGVIRFYDLIGGVQYTVEKDMKHEDETASLAINLKAGNQLMDGNKALQYLRYRSDSSDIVRISRQQKFIRATVAQTLSLGNALRLPGIVMEMTKYIDTNLDAGDILRYANLAVGISDQSLEMATIPGTDPYIDGVSYWVPDMTATKALVNRLIKGIDPAANAKIRVEVLNGSGVAGIGTRFAARLREDGFNVVTVKNADKSNYKQTVVIDRCGNTDSVDRIGRTVHGLVSSPRIQHKVESGATVDLTVIVGQDYAAGTTGP